MNGWLGRGARPHTDASIRTRQTTKARNFATNGLALPLQM